MVRNDRFLAIAKLSGIFQDIKSNDDLPKEKLQEL
jgi:hypothetical protein